MKRSVFVNQGVILQEVAGQYFLFNTLDGHFGGLNELGMTIWKAIIDSKSIESIIALIATDYDISINEIEDDVLSFIEDLKERGFIYYEEGVG